MKAIFPTLLVISLVSAGTFLELPEQLGQQVGRSCVPNPVFNIQTLDVEPWPPTNNVSLAVNMTGTFSANTLLQTLSVGTNYNRQQWVFTNTNISTTYAKGQVSTFIIHTNSGTQSGQYLKEIVLSNQDRNGNFVFLSCWQFDYGI